MSQVYYEKSNHNGLYNVTHVATGQTIVVHAPFFCNVAGVKADVLLGCKAVSAELLERLGFMPVAYSIKQVV